MTPFLDLCNEDIHIRHKDGRVTGPLKTVFGKGKFTVFDGSLDVTEGDQIDRPLPNGKAERYDIVEVKFTHQFHSIPAHVDMMVQRQGLVPFSRDRVVNISINNSQGFQIGDHNTQHVIDAFKQVVERIEQSPATPEQKAEAKTKLRAFLEHPLTSAVLGAAATTLFGLVQSNK